MIRLLYNLLFPLVLLAFLPGYIIKMLRRGNYGNKFGQRLGFYDRQTRARLAQGQHSWIHAVSVGEVMIALKLAAAMKEREPELSLALTTTTTTGFALALRHPQSWIEVLYTPLDFWPVIRRAFAVIRPSRIILVEAEVWPNLTALAAARKIPLALVNARLSPRSEGRFRRFLFFVRPYFRKLSLLCLQEPEDLARWQSLGVDPARIQLVGSIKFDPEEVELHPERPRAFLQTLSVDPERPILLAGSTHRGEEEILAKIFLELREEFPDLFLIIAPRHVERTAEIEQQLRVLRLSSVRRSSAGKIGSDCLLIDTTGELRHWYGVATVVFVGKSLTARGGQNPVEAILANRPVVFGPHMKNFAALAQALVTRGGALQPENELNLRATLSDLFRDPEKRAAMVAAGREVLAPHRGATARTADLLKSLATPRPASDIARPS
jgi:3-deoxy-D-manno-octulosonic-acid transferase